MNGSPHKLSARTTPVEDQPISERFRIVARQWVDCEAAAQLLEETKTSVLAQRMSKLGDIAVNKAELTVKASQEWHDHLKKIVDARREANLKKVHLEFLRISERELDRAQWASRAEAKMLRTTP